MIDPLTKQSMLEQPNSEPVTSDLEVVDSEKLAPNRWAPAAYRSHRQACHRSAGSEFLAFPAPQANQQAISSPALSSPTPSSPTSPPFLARPFSSAAAVHRRCSLPSPPARLPLFDCPSAPRFPAASKFPSPPTDARSPHSGYAALHSQRTTHPDRPSVLPHTPYPIPAPSGPGPPCTRSHRKTSRQSGWRPESASPYYCR